ncbi:MAG: hypothetical protein ACOCVG_02685 [Verrucomicrobiota bacterium]
MKQPLSPPVRERLNALLAERRSGLPERLRYYWDESLQRLHIELPLGRGLIDFRDNQLKVLARLPAAMKLLLTRRRRQQYIDDLEAVLAQAGI